VAAACMTATARTPKKKLTTAATTTTAQVKPVSGSDFSYAMGVAQSASLKMYLVQREGVDSAYIDQTAQALTDALTMSDTELKQKTAYAAGLRIAEMNKTQVIGSLNQSATGKKDTTYTDMTLFTKGLCEGLTGKNTLSADSAMKVAEQQMNYFKQELQRTNRDYLTAHAKVKGVKTTASGLQYSVIQEGTGAIPADTTEVEVNYEGKLIDGTVFDSSYQRGQTATFRPDRVIKGWREALTMMHEGSTYELVIPYELGYGERGTQGIPPYSTLIFKVELIKVKN
jgi:FKBP-type peptidyl-prolyl cis-trans isomerase FklB